MTDRNSITIADVAETLDDLAIMVKRGFDEVGEKLIQHDQMFVEVRDDIASLRMELRQEIEKLDDRIGRVEKMLSGDIKAAYKDIEIIKEEMKELKRKMRTLELAQNRKN